MIQDAEMLASVKAAVFDAYGTLFGVGAAVRRHAEAACRAPTARGPGPLRLALARRRPDRRSGRAARRPDHPDAA